MKKYINLIFFLFLMLLLTACAPGNQTFNEEPAGFWMGLWHGFISLITFIVSLFNDNVNIYEINNTGKLYNLGFIIGVALFFGGGTKGSCGRK